MTQKSYLLKLSQNNPNAILIGSIGTISYDLAEISHKKKILIKGAMGAAMGFGLGMALGTKEEIIVVVGDGAFLMRMGAISTVLKHDLPNLKIIIINNHKYRSCGCQETNFDSVKELVSKLKNIEVVDVE